MKPSIGKLEQAYRKSQQPLTADKPWQIFLHFLMNI